MMRYFATKSLGIVIVTSVTLCIVVVYAKRCITFISYNDVHQVSRNSGRASEAVVRTSIHKKNDTNNRNTHDTLLKSNPKCYEANSLKPGNTTTNKSDTSVPYRRSAINNGVFTWNASTYQNNILFNEKEKLKPYFQPFDKTAYDIMNMDQITFDSAFKNPCWRGKDSFAPLKDGKLHCLPSFYILGVKKSGTTDLYSRLRTHPEYCGPLFGKESQWFSRLRFGIKSIPKHTFQQIVRRGIDPRRIEFFVSLFDVAAMCISRHPTRRASDFVYYKMVTGPFHNGILATLFRLYSDFLHTTLGRYGQFSPEVFHRHATELLKAYKSCFHHFSKRSCVYNNTLKMELLNKRIELAESFNAGFYAVLMMDLLVVFGKGQLLPILMTDYVTNMEGTLRNIFRFLRMSKLSSRTMQMVLKMGAKHVTKRKKEFGPMLDKTRDMLYDFYRPFNDDMVALMNDTRYLFPKM